LLDVDETSVRLQQILQRYALIQVNQGLGFIHRLLQLSVRAKGQRTPAEVLNQVMQALNRLYDSEPASIEIMQENRLLHPHGEILCQHYDQLEASSETSLKDYYSTLRWLGNLEGVLAHFEKKKNLLEKALSVAENLYGSKHHEVATSLNDLGVAFHELGDAKRAAEYLQRALSIKEKIYGPEHPAVATSLNNLGSAFKDLGDAKKAAEYLQRALAIYEKIYDPLHPHVATSLSNLGLAFQALGDEKAAEYHQRALAIKEKIYGPEHPDVAASLTNLGAAFMQLGDAKQAAEYLQRALAINEKIYGPEHPDVAAMLHLFGESYWYLGDQKKAVDYLQRAHTLYEKLYGSEDQQVVDIQEILDELSNKPENNRIVDPGEGKTSFSTNAPFTPLRQAQEAQSIQKSAHSSAQNSEVVKRNSPSILD